MVTDQKRIEFSARLNSALDAADIPRKGKGRQGAVAKLFGVTQKGARKWLEGEAIPRTARVIEMADRLHVTTEWLLSGKGTRAASDTLTASDAGARESDQDILPLDSAVIAEILDLIDNRHDELQNESQPNSVIAQVIANSYYGLVTEKRRLQKRQALIDQALYRASENNAEDEGGSTLFRERAKDSE